MKKFSSFLFFALILAVVFTSCKKEEEEVDPTLKTYLIKTIEFTADWNGGTSGYEFFYNDDSTVTGFDRTWEGAADGDFVYDYSVSGQLTVTKDGETYAEYELDDNGRITKEYWGNDEWAAYEYDSNGFLSKVYEHWGGEDHLKYEMTITDGNIAMIKTYDDDGVTVKKIKEFAYTVGDNLDNLHQANVIDSDWKPIGLFYGLASKKLVDHFDYWDPRENPISKSTSTLSYTFDNLNRPQIVSKTLTDMSTEVWKYTYYEATAE
ncbi:MAG: hypothetical protein JXR52_08515 [Bacteroidales bacterium]|nr:hypothetical protein [Bacteroidales bacterium]MBN2698854.1 hypothetical protein [Bacteroidales bacterium]